MNGLAQNGHPWLLSNDRRGIVTVLLDGTRLQPNATAYGMSRAQAAKAFSRLRSWRKRKAEGRA